MHSGRVSHRIWLDTSFSSSAIAAIDMVKVGKNTELRLSNEIAGNNVGSASNGTVALNTSGDIVFTPTAGFSGTASFDYTVSDGHNGTSTTRVTVTVKPIVNPPRTLKGTIKNDTLVGGNRNDTLTGSGGNDVLLGNAGNDSLNGGGGSDSLLGGSGNDILAGDVGSDTLIGGVGNDTLDLGRDKNQDTVVYNQGDGTDVIKNFLRGVGGDSLSFSGITAIDVVKVGRNTEFRLGDGIAGNVGFGKGELLVTLQSTTGFTAANINDNLVVSNITDFWFI
jgi:Ca2+-binding RTX toxin-like protein